MRLVLSLILVLFAPLLSAQGIFRLDASKPQSFKFEMTNHTVLVPVVINGMPFTFLLDSGVKETILFAWTEDTNYLHNQNKVTFRGLGEGADIEGILSTGNRIEVGSVAIDTSHAVYVIQASDLDIASDIGTTVNGILGAKFFNSFPFAIDYMKSKITVFPPGYDYRRQVRRHQPIALHLVNERAYIDAGVVFSEDTVKGKFLLDMGNTSPLMLFPAVLPNLDISPPYVHEYLGRGMNGPIHGKRNRAKKINMYNFEFKYPIVSYPDSNTVSIDRLIPGRVGSIGNQILQRFHIVFDYGNEMMYWKKNNKYRQPFLLNMAGMDVKHAGMIWVRELTRQVPVKQERPLSEGTDRGITIHFRDHHFQYNFVLKPQYIVSGIRKGSPAERASVSVGDEILKINGKSVSNLSLSKIMNMFQTRPHDEIRLELRREDEIIRVRFLLEDPIPY